LNLLEEGRIEIEGTIEHGVQHLEGLGRVAVLLLSSQEFPETLHFDRSGVGGATP
jgi:hypothetical protein